METSHTTHSHADSQSAVIRLRISNFSCAIDSGSVLDRLRNLGPQKLFYLKIIIQGKEQRTTTVKSHNSPSWDEPIYLDIKGGGPLAIQLFVQHSIGKDSLIGNLAEPVQIPADFEGRKEISEQSLIKKKKRMGIVEFVIERLAYSGENELLRAGLENANLQAAPVVGRSAGVGAVAQSLSDANLLAGEVGSEYGIWKPLFDNVQFIVDAGDAIAAIHPFAQMTWSAISPVLKAIAKQVARDTNIGMLLDKINDAYDFARRSKALGDLDEYRQTIIMKMLQQTYDCSWLIRTYVSRGFVKRGLNAVTTDHDKKVKLYIDSFASLKECFQEGSMREVEITVHRTLAAVANMTDLQLLSEMRCSQGHDPKKECLPGTRQAILDDIMDWVARDPSEEDRGVYWLHGVAGCGKSAIASTIAHRFRSLKRCVSFFFDASKQQDITPDRLFSTLSRDLADLDPQWSSSLVKALKESHDLRATSNVQRQFENFILGPAKSFDPIGPILIVIDAVDESGLRKERANLLQMLSRLHELRRYGHFRFLITSRPEADIEKIFRDQPWVISTDLATANFESTDNDIRIYVELKLSNNPYLIKAWPTKPWVELIVSRAEHLFQWAFVACKFINGDGDPTVDPVQRFEDFRKEFTSSQLDNLDKLYLAILRSVFGSASQARPNDDRIPRFKTFLGRILSAREPLSMKALMNLRSDPEKEHEMKLIIQPLGSLLNGVGKDNVPIQPLNASFIDFLTNEMRSEEFHVRIGAQDENLAHACLREMNELLRFNICNLETSYLRNQDVRDLTDRIAMNIPEHLSYACRNFADHLVSLQHPAPNLVFGIKRLLHEKLLFWFEALSLLKKMYLGSRSLQALKTWLQVEKCEIELVEFAIDAERFARTYNAMMAMSAPHIYLSGLAFVPRSSRISHQYCGQYPGRLKLNEEDDEKIRWPSSLLNIKLPDYNPVYCTQFSPDGQRIVSGSGDKSVRVWDAHSGELVAGPFTGHTSWVSSVGFSPDGQRIVSGSSDKSVRVWDAHSGELVAGPFTGHTSLVASVGFSPDGQRIVSGSHDNSVRVWDAHSGELVARPFTGHTSWVTSVEFSPDGQRIVSGSNDNSVRVWDAHSGELVAGPFTGHTDCVISVGFSPNGQRIVSGSDDKSVRVWDAHSGELVAGPFTGHTSWVSSVGFSPDGQRIVSGSNDKSVQVWDAYSGELVTGPFTGHTDSVISVGFSPNGQRIISGSNDNYIRVRSMKYSGESSLYSSRLSPSYIEYSDSSEIDKDGWMVSPSGDLLFWVPDMYRTGLWKPSNTLVIGPESIRVDVTQFVHGSEWIRCYQSQE